MACQKSYCRGAAKPWFRPYIAWLVKTSLLRHDAHALSRGVPSGGHPLVGLAGSFRSGLVDDPFGVNRPYPTTDPVSEKSLSEHPSNQ